MKFYSNGKILITGEYFVLNGALSLALPTVYGQYLEINDNDSNIINWSSYNKNKEIWFKCELDKDSLKVRYSSSKEISEIIKELISYIRKKESNFLKSNGSIINTELTFDKDWGLGSSSTLINNLYADFAENFMAIPVLKGLKSVSERFAGADETYCIEGLMQDGKALQLGTSHFLGQNFAKAFDVKFANEDGKLSYVWATSWGVSTRLMGALIMTHSDDNGLVLPPNLAPIQVVIVPIYKGIDQLDKITIKANKIVNDLKSKGISVKYDDRDNFKPGYKFNDYELKGVPIRISIGPRDLENKTIELARRDNLTKSSVPMNSIVKEVEDTLKDIQSKLLNRALNFRNKNTTEVDNFEEFKRIISKQGGFVSAHWDGSNETELKIKNLTKATIRCIPIDNKIEKGKCVYSGKQSVGRVIFAKSY